VDDSSSYPLIIISLITVHALLTAGHAALMNTRQTGLREQADAGNARAKQILDLVDARAQLTLTYTLSRTLLRFVIAMLATVWLVLPAYNASESRLLGYVLVILIAIITFVLGDIVPEGIGSARSESFARVAVLPLRLLVLLFSPFTYALLFISRILAGVFGGGDKVNKVTEEEIMTLVNAGHTGGTIEEEEKDMIYSVLQLDETWAREVMTPRMDIVALDVETAIQEALEAFIDSGFSRIPAYEENIDNIVGLLYAKDLLNIWRKGGNPVNQTVRDLVRPAYFVPETKPADELLRELQNRNTHMAIVVDEYGGTSGLVTIENLLEEIVGDIRDEYDLHEEEEYTQNSDGDYVMDASMDIDDVNNLLGVHLDNNDTDTLGGFIYMTLGRVPQVGDIIETPEVRLRVCSLDGRRIRKVEVALKAPTPNETSDVVEEPKSADIGDVDLPDALPDAS
jgi:CBS domain containing-hemolysin-like protein